MKVREKVKKKDSEAVSEDQNCSKKVKREVKENKAQSVKNVKSDEKPKSDKKAKSEKKNCREKK